MKTNTRAAMFAVCRSMARAYLLVLVVVGPAVASEAVPVGKKQKSVLLISSDHSNLPPQIIVEQAIRSTLKNGSPVPVEVYSEYLDSVRTRLDDYEKELVTLLRRKYEGRKFDLIIAASVAALRVLLRNSETFPDTPIVFFVLDQRNLAGLVLGPNVTGVWGEINFKPNLDLALTLHPNTRKVVVVAGVSEYDNYWTAEVRKDFLAYEGKLEISYLIGLTIPEQQQALASVPPNTIVIFTASTQDNAGNNYNNPDVLRQISPASNAPIYGSTDAQLGLGIVGGSIFSFEAIGVRTAELGLRVLAGEKPQAIAPQGIPNVVMFDWRELRRWGIDESRLPAGSIVRYRELSIWELYKWRIVGVVLLCILEALLIVLLLISRSRRRRAEEETERFASRVKAERERLEEIVSNVPGIVWESHLQPGSNTRKTVFISPLVESMLGYSVEEWLQTPGFAQSIIFEEDREKATSEIAAILESGKEGVLRFRWVAKDGRVIWVETHLAVMRDETGRIVGLRGVTLDISERIQAEEAKNNLAAIVETSDDAILSKTLDGTITSWNAGAERMYGFSANEIVGQHVSTLAPPDLKEEVRGILERISRGESVDHLETVRVSKKGMRIDVSLTISPIKNERGVIIGASSIARDITARKKAEVEGVQQRTELAHLSRVTMLGELSGSLAHELNQPLTAILSNAQAAQRFLAHDDVDLNELRDILNDIVNQDKRAGEVISRLRLLLKKGQAEHQPLGLNDVVREVLKLVRNDLANQRITGQMELAPDLPPIIGDRVQLQQVVLNLVMNGCDAIASGTSGDSKLIIRTGLDGEGICVSVADHGVGLAPDKLEKVFEPFFSTKPNGMGLGLSVCRTIITAHGGRLWAANNVERGATFYFTIPAQSNHRNE